MIAGGFPIEGTVAPYIILYVGVIIEDEENEDEGNGDEDNEDEGSDHVIFDPNINSTQTKVIHDSQRVNNAGARSGQSI